MLDNMEKDMQCIDHITSNNAPSITKGGQVLLNEKLTTSSSGII